MLALQSRIAKFAAAGVVAGFDHFKQALMSAPH
jgi:hypothetical protein